MGDTGNNLSLFGNGIPQEIFESKSWIRWVVGVDVENLKPLNCEHNLHSFIWLFWFPILSAAFICFFLLLKLLFAQQCVDVAFS